MSDSNPEEVGTRKVLVQTVPACLATHIEAISCEFFKLLARAESNETEIKLQRLRAEVAEAELRQAESELATEKASHSSKVQAMAWDYAQQVRANDDLKQAIQIAMDKLEAAEAENKRHMETWDHIRDHYVDGDAAGDHEGVRQCVDRMARELREARAELAELRQTMASRSVRGVLPSVDLDGSILFCEVLTYGAYTPKRMPVSLRLRRTGDMGPGHVRDYAMVEASEAELAELRREIAGGAS